MMKKINWINVLEGYKRKAGQNGKMM